MIIQMKFFTPESIDISQAIRVDMIGLPDKIIENTPTTPEVNKKPTDEIKPAEPIKPIEEKVSAPEPQPELKTEKLPEKAPPAKPIEKDTIKLEKEKKNLVKNQKDAIAKLKKLSAIEKIKEELEAEKTQKALEQAQALKLKNEKATAQLIKGRVISKGTALTGLDKIQSNDYLAKIDSLIKAQWQLPQWLVGKPFKAKILLKLDSTGAIIYNKIYQSSGQNTYDQYCISAIEKAGPFPEVPHKLTEVFKEDGLLIGFPE